MEGGVEAGKLFGETCFKNLPIEAVVELPVTSVVSNNMSTRLSNRSYHFGWTLALSVSGCFGSGAVWIKYVCF